MPTESEILSIAKLANLELTSKEIKKFGPQLSRIFDYIKKLEEVDTSNVPATSHAIDIKNRFQKFKIHNCLKQQEVLKNAKSTENGFIATEGVL